MSYPSSVEYNEAVQHPAHAFLDPELKRGTVRENNLGLPLVMSGGFALTYTVNVGNKKWAVRCFHREIPSIEQKYNEISKKLASLRNNHFVDFKFQNRGIAVGQGTFPIVRMDWVEGDPLGIWLDKHFDQPALLQKARSDFRNLAAFLEREGIAHGDIQNGNVMMSSGNVRLIDYDGMYVPGLPKGNGNETGHKHFQHPDRAASAYGPLMDRFSFIALDLSLQALIEDKSLYKRFREGGETIVFKANDFADPQNSDIFRLLLLKPRLKDQVRGFAGICDADITLVPSLEDFLANRNIPASQTPIVTSPAVKTPPRVVSYISAFPVVDALDYALALALVGDRVELVGRIVEVKPGFGKTGKGRGRPYVFINFGPWRGSIVKISIWSEGLAKLSEKPSDAWVGRWVSVTGLMDPPYESRRYHYSHLSITVDEDGQIQQLDEAQAKFRLASVGKAAPVRGSLASKPPPDPRRTMPRVQSPTVRQALPATSRAKTVNQEIVERMKRRTEQQPPVTGQTTAMKTPSQPSPRPATGKGDISGFMWVLIVLGIIALAVFLN